MKRPLIALALSTTLATPAWAKDVNGEHAALGPGGTTCARYLEARDTGNADLEYDYRIWISGYLSAFNVTVGHTYNILGPRGMDEAVALIDKQCRQTPNALFVSAVARTTVMLYPDRYNLKPD